MTTRRSFGLVTKRDSSVAFQILEGNSFHGREYLSVEERE